MYSKHSHQNIQSNPLGITAEAYQNLPVKVRFNAAFAVESCWSPSFIFAMVVFALATAAVAADDTEVAADEMNVVHVRERPAPTAPIDPSDSLSGAGAEAEAEACAGDGVDWASGPPGLLLFGNGDCRWYGEVWLVGDVAARKSLASAFSREMLPCLAAAELPEARLPILRPN